MNYRAPETFLSYCSEYDSAVDMWTLGCTLAEMFTKKPILTANTIQDYLENLIEILGLPDQGI